MAGSTSPAVFHLATPEEWAVARASGTLTASLLTDGFVHCSDAAQLAGTIERHFQGVDELVLLRLDPDALGEDLVWEESRPGELYPHLYRPIDVSEVVEVVGWRRGETDLPT